MQRFMRQKRHLGHISTHFNTFLAWVETRGHRASYEMYDVHDVHDLDRSGGGGPRFSILDSEPGTKFQSDYCTYYYNNTTLRTVPKCALPGESKYALRVVGDTWGGRRYGPVPRGKSLPGPTVGLPRLKARKKGSCRSCSSL
jgi:hypothetical protein